MTLDVYQLLTRQNLTGATMQCEAEATLHRIECGEATVGDAAFLRRYISALRAIIEQDTATLQELELPVEEAHA